MCIRDRQRALRSYSSGAELMDPTRQWGTAIAYIHPPSLAGRASCAAKRQTWLPRCGGRWTRLRQK
eukprot:5478479-Alexandrium_andersonii.AAC.1